MNTNVFRTLLLANLVAFTGLANATHLIGEQELDTSVSQTEDSVSNTVLTPTEKRAKRKARRQARREARRAKQSEYRVTRHPNRVYSTFDSYGPYYGHRYYGGYTRGFSRSGFRRSRFRTFGFRHGFGFARGFGH